MTGGSFKRKPSSAGDRDFEPLQVATMATGPLSVGGLLAVGVSGDCVEASISDEPNVPDVPKVAADSTARARPVPPGPERAARIPAVAATAALL